jgi:hypothetical protein
MKEREKEEEGKREKKSWIFAAVAAPTSKSSLARTRRARGAWHPATGIRPAPNEGLRAPMGVVRTSPIGRSRAADGPPTSLRSCLDPLAARRPRARPKLLERPRLETALELSSPRPPESHGRFTKRSASHAAAQLAETGTCAPAHPAPSAPGPRLPQASSVQLRAPASHGHQPRQSPEHAAPRVPPSLLLLLLLSLTTCHRSHNLPNYDSYLRLIGCRRGLRLHGESLLCTP